MKSLILSASAAIMLLFAPFVNAEMYAGVEYFDMTPKPEGAIDNHIDDVTPSTSGQYFDSESIDNSYGITLGVRTNNEGWMLGGELGFTPSYEVEWGGKYGVIQGDISVVQAGGYFGYRWKHLELKGQANLTHIQMRADTYTRCDEWHDDITDTHVTPEIGVGWNFNDTWRVGYSWERIGTKNSFGDNTRHSLGVVATF